MDANIPGLTPTLGELYNDFRVPPQPPRKKKKKAELPLTQSGQVYFELWLRQSVTEDQCCKSRDLNSSFWSTVVIQQGQGNVS